MILYVLFSGDAVKFLLSVGEGIGLSCRSVVPVEKKPFVIMTLKGSDPSLPALLLSSHMDVVPVFPISFHTIS